MSSESILSLIDAEIARLSEVRALLATTGKVITELKKAPAAKAAGVKAPVAKKSAAKKPAAKTKAAAAKAPAEAKPKKRVLSPEARQRIADAQRRRWAAQKTEA